jgi:type I restriction enzyme M protein
MAKKQTESDEPNPQAAEAAAPSANTADLPFAKELFDAADQLRGSVESAEYKHLVLGLIFLKYISDSFERHRLRLDEQTRNPKSELFTESDKDRAEILEDRDEYTAENVFWVPEEARWPRLVESASQPDIGVKIDRALEMIERENEVQLRGVLPQIYARSPLEPAKLGELVVTIAGVDFGANDEQARDLLGRTYEYFIKAFARSEGHRGGEFYTPRSITQVLVEMLEPYEGRVFDPACGSCGLFIQSAEFLRAHGSGTEKISLYGQELNQATWRIGRMNLAIHGLAGEVLLGDSLLDDKYPSLKADYVLANPPFNMKKWGAAQVADDARWAFGSPPDSNANFAWVQSFIHHLAPDGRAGFVLANGSLTASNKGEGAIRQKIIEQDLVDCIVACPGQLFYTTQIPVCLWFLDRDKSSGDERDRSGETLFIDARALGESISRTQIEFSEADVERIVGTYHAWRGTNGEEYEDVAGFCASVTTGQIAEQGFVLTPGRFVGAEDTEEDQVEFEERMRGLTATLSEQLAESEGLSDEVKKALKAVGYEL